jgi:hypothetical protein
VTFANWRGGRLVCEAALLADPAEMARHHCGGSSRVTGREQIDTTGHIAIGDMRISLRHMSRTALRFASACAGVSAVTTFLLWLLPRMVTAPRGFEEAVNLHRNPYYMARLWVNFGHVFLALVAYGAAAYVLFRFAPALSSFALRAAVR